IMTAASQPLDGMLAPDQIGRVFVLGDKLFEFLGLALMVGKSGFLGLSIFLIPGFISGFDFGPGSFLLFGLGRLVFFLFARLVERVQGLVGCLAAHRRTA